MTYMKAFLKFRTNDVQSMFNNSNGSNAKGTPHSKLIFPTPRIVLGLEEEFRTP
jgi:hypothetical protein